MRTRKLSTTALLAALCIVFVALACTLPTGAWTMLIAASLVPAVAVLRCGLGWGTLCYAVAGGLALLLFPGQLKALLFVLILGYYGILKALMERLQRLWLEWICKLAWFNLALLLCWRVYTGLFAVEWSGTGGILIAANIVFVIYDLGYTVAIGWFLRRFPQSG